MEIQKEVQNVELRGWFGSPKVYSNITIYYFTLVELPTFLVFEVYCSHIRPKWCLEISVCSSYCCEVMCCVDIDECDVGLCDNVEHSVSCTNMPGAYSCVCDKGFVNANNLCVGKSSFAI